MLSKGVLGKHALSAHRCIQGNDQEHIMQGIPNRVIQSTRQAPQAQRAVSLHIAQGARGNLIRVAIQEALTQA